MSRVEVLSGPERRRRWSTEQKRSIVAEAFAPGASVSKSKGSWQCYPYCDGGTYEGRPVREWMKPDRW